MASNQVEFYLWLIKSIKKFSKDLVNLPEKKNFGFRRKFYIIKKIEIDLKGKSLKKNQRKS